MMERETDSGYYRKLIVPGIIAAAFVLRFLGLGAASLTLNETEAAFSALELFEKGHGAPFLYTLPTALIFRMFGDTEFTARLFPALMGVLLAVVPLLMRNQIGKRRALLLAFLFAVDPVLLFWSKRADALAPSMAFTGLAAAFFLNGRTAAAIGCMFAALCGGDRAVPALILSALCGAALIFAEKKDMRGFAPAAFPKKDMRITAGVLFLFVTLFGTLPGGIGSFFTGIIDGFRPAPAWAYPGAAAFLAAMIVYCGIPLLLFFMDCFGKRRILRLGVSCAGIVLFLLWRGISAMPWISAFLWSASADRILSAAESLRGRKNFAFWAACGTVAGAFAFFYFRLVEVFNQQNGNAPVQLRWNGMQQTLPLTRTEAAALLTLASVLIILLIVKILLGFSDSVQIRSGILCGLLTVCCWGLLTNIWNSGGFDRVGDHPAAFHTKNSLLLLNGDYSALTDTALPEVLDETIRKHGDSSNTDFGLDLITDDPLVAWMLRKQKGIRAAAGISAVPDGIELILDRPGISYADKGFMGTVLPYRAAVRWSRLSLIDWGKWLIFGDGPDFTDTPLTFWVRGDYVISND